MRITPLAVAGAAVGAALLPAVPAQAAAAPRATAQVPADFAPGDNLWVHVTGCGEDQPRTAPGGRNQIFAEKPTFQQEGNRWQAVGATRPALQRGHTYRTDFQCGPLGRRQTFSLEVTVPRDQPSPSPSPSPDGDFEFGFDKVKLSTRTVEPGGKVTITASCPTRVSAQSASFTAAPTFTQDGRDEDGVTVFTGTATFKKTLPSIVTIKVICQDYGHVSYSTEPSENDLDEGGPKIPKGAPHTGGGTGGQGSEAAMAGAAALALLAGAGLGVRMLRRRA